MRERKAFDYSGFDICYFYSRIPDNPIAYCINRIGKGDSSISLLRLSGLIGLYGAVIAFYMAYIKLLKSYVIFIRTRMQL